jgi:hypothetical protein
MTDQTTHHDPMPALYAALAKAQGEFKAIEKNREVEIQMRDKQTGQPKGKYGFRYADLQEILAKTRPALAANGLAIIQQIQSGPAGLSLVCLLTHSGGGVLTSDMPLPAVRDMADPKAFGAAVSYLRRYLVTAMLGVAADDDIDQDGDDHGGQPPANDLPVDQQTTKASARAPKVEAPAEDRLVTKGEAAWVTNKLTSSAITLADALFKAGLEAVESVDKLTLSQFKALRGAL